MNKYDKYSSGKVSYGSNGRGALRSSESTSHVQKDGSCLSSLLLRLSILAGLVVWGVSYFL